jgi:hypothetical protein
MGRASLSPLCGPPLAVARRAGVAQREGAAKSPPRATLALVPDGTHVQRGAVNLCAAPRARGSARFSIRVRVALPAFRPS